MGGVALSVIIGPYYIAPELVQKRKLRNRCKEGVCDGACCSTGALLTLYDAQRIVAHGDALQPYLPEPYDFAQWDFSRPSDTCTPMRNDHTSHEQCWFLTHNRRCAIHEYALDRGIPVKDIKPYFCLFFPLTLVDIDINVTEIALDGKCYDTCLVESDEAAWVYELFESDLRGAIGDQWYEELKRRYP